MGRYCVPKTTITARAVTSQHHEGPFQRGKRMTWTRDDSSSKCARSAALWLVPAAVAAGCPSCDVAPFACARCSTRPDVLASVLATKRAENPTRSRRRSFWRCDLFGLVGMVEATNPVLSLITSTIIQQRHPHCSMRHRSLIRMGCGDAHKSGTVCAQSVLEPMARALSVLFA